MNFFHLIVTIILLTFGLYLIYLSKSNAEDEIDDEFFGYASDLYRLIGAIILAFGIILLLPLLLGVISTLNL